MARNDFNGDGLSDILWRANDGQFVIWRSAGNNSFLPSSPRTAEPEFQVTGTGDFNGDGREDILWRNSTSGQLDLWQGTSNGDFVTSFSSSIAGNDWHVVGADDFNGDGRDDILWRNDSGQMNVWSATANGNFVTTLSTLQPTNLHVAGTGDFNGDGRTDILWRNSTNGQLDVWQATANGSFVNSFSSTIAGNNWRVVGTGDFNGDGRSGILWRNENGQLNVWEATSEGSFVTSFISTIAGNDWHVATTGDFNGDGRADILWRNETGQLNEWNATANGDFVTSFSAMVRNDWHVWPDRVGNLPYSVPSNRIEGTANNELLMGTEGADLIYTDGDDTVFGLGGDDWLVAGRGWQTIHGGSGNDYFFSYASRDNDVLYGDAGADTFNFSAYPSSQVPRSGLGSAATIMDFQTGVDLVDLTLLSYHPADHNLYWLGNGQFTGTNRLEVRLADGSLQIDFDGDRVPDLSVSIVGTVVPSDISFVYDPWGY